MDINLIQDEVDGVGKASFAHKTDRQLWSYQELSDKYRYEKGNVQPVSLVIYNSPSNRTCKLTCEQVKEIRARYIPFVYGKKRLAKDYRVSTSVILRILKGISWKVIDDPLG